LRIDLKTWINTEREGTYCKPNTRGSKEINGEENESSRSFSISCQTERKEKVSYIFLFNFKKWFFFDVEIKA